jgi:hypothetical protein
MSTCTMRRLMIRGGLPTECPLLEMLGAQKMANGRRPVRSEGHANPSHSILSGRSSGSSSLNEPAFATSTIAPISIIGKTISPLVFQ